MRVAPAIGLLKNDSMFGSLASDDFEQPMIKAEPRGLLPSAEDVA